MNKTEEEEIPLEFQTIDEDDNELINRTVSGDTKRDYVLERVASRSFLQWPLNVAFGLNSFEFFQGLNNFLIRFFRFSRVSDSYIDSSLFHTRYRNYHDKII